MRWQIPPIAQEPILRQGGRRRLAGKRRVARPWWVAALSAGTGRVDERSGGAEWETAEAHVTTGWSRLWVAGSEILPSALAQTGFSRCLPVPMTTPPGAVRGGAERGGTNWL